MLYKNLFLNRFFLFGHNKIERDDYMENYKTVPDIITGKDLDYLSDMFEWNYLAYKEVSNAVDSIVDEEIKDILDRASQLFYNNMNMVLGVLNGGNNE